jgi:selenocysteine lyase/cysteine desulfurase
MQAAIAHKPRLVAVGYASNTLGTINPVAKITQIAHEAGSLVYIDAVQFAPHDPIDVQHLGYDFLVCSSYKFFGPHMGVLYGRYDLLDRLLLPIRSALPPRTHRASSKPARVTSRACAACWVRWNISNG